MTMWHLDFPSSNIKESMAELMPGKMGRGGRGVGQVKGGLGPCVSSFLQEADAEMELDVEET